MWVCLSERDEDLVEKLGRTRLVLRLMRVARKLDMESWRGFEKALFEALVGVNTGHEDNSCDWIKSETVWREVMGEPSHTGYIS